jgi:large subunit ribosomal protein L31
MRLYNRFFQFLVGALVAGLLRREFFECRLGFLVGLNQGFLAPCKLTQFAKNALEQKFPLVIRSFSDSFIALFMKTAIHPKYMDAEIRCACGNVIKTRSTRSTIIVGICNVCHPFYTGQQKFVDTAGRVDKFQQRLAKTQAAQAEHATKKKKKV